MAQVLTEGRYSGEFIVSEDERGLSREQIVIAAGANLDPGTVLGRIIAGSATAAAKAGGNTGNGAFTMDPTTPVKAGAKIGVYTVRAIAAATNAATFQVEDPEGFVLGTVATGGTFDDDIKFTVADGATDFVVGDGFDVTVTAGTGKYVRLDPSGNDGRQIAAGILYHAAAAASADVKTVAIVRLAQVNAAELVWPVGISNPAKAAALAQLAELNIVARA
jgi:hypothetical protein